MNGKLVGFTIATIEDEIPIYRIKRFAFVQDLWVEVEHRREGLARKLVMELAERFRAMGIEQIRLDVLVQNKGACQLFARCGFQESVVEMILPLSSRS